MSEEHEVYFWTGVLYALIGGGVYAIGCWVQPAVPMAGLSARLLGAAIMSIAAYCVWEAARRQAQ